MFQGVYTALITPFSNGNIDYDSLKTLIRHQLENGIQGFVVCGTTGESPTLSSEEKLQVLEFVCKETAGAVPILFGSGSNCTRTTIELSLKAQSFDIAGLLVVVPYYNKPTQEGLVAHFTAIADVVEKPVILYNVPGRTVTALEPKSIVTLSKHDNIQGIKEANADVNNFAQYKSLVPHDFSLLSGDDESCVGFCLLGGHGVISVCSHIAPDKMVDWVTKARNKDESVRGPFRQQSVWIEKLYFRSNPIPVKAALQMMKIINSRECRLPLVGLSDEDTKDLQYFLKEFSACL